MKEFLIDLIRFGFHIQELALLNYDQSQFSFQSQCQVHKFICAYFLLVSKSSGIKELYNLCSEICDMRRRKDLYRFVYPEYVLLDTVPVNNQSIDGIESDFKRELNQSGKEYSSTIKKNLSASRTSLASTHKPSSQTSRSIDYSKMAQWLFNKQKISEILKNAGYDTENLFQNENSDDSANYSLAVGYLQTVMPSIHTVLKFRSPYSNSYESLAAISSQTDLTNFNLNDKGVMQLNGKPLNGLNGPIGGQGKSSFMANGTFNGGHKRIDSTLSGFVGSGGHFTPRRSIDIESNYDDDTSYDSTSQISVQIMDQTTELDYMTQQNMKRLNIDPTLTVVDYHYNNQQSINSMQLLQKQYQTQNQQYQDFTSFETIKKVLFDGGAAMNQLSSNHSNSGVGGQHSISSTIGPSTSVIQTSANQPPTKILINSPSNRSSTQLHQSTSLDNGDSTVNNNSIINLDLQLEDARIISDFKHKSFKELQSTLQKYNEMYTNSEKYQQLMDLLKSNNHSNTNGHHTNSHRSDLNSEQHHGSNSNLNQSLNSNSPINNNNINNVPSKYVSNSSLSTNNSLQSNSAANSSSSNILYKENGYSMQQQKNTALNDIEFPELFMYG